MYVRPGPRLRGRHHRVRRSLQHHPILGGSRPKVHAHRLPAVRLPGVPKRTAQRQGLHIHLYPLDVSGHHVLHTVRVTGRSQRRHLQSGQYKTDIAVLSRVVDSKFRTKTCPFWQRCIKKTITRF